MKKTLNLFLLVSFINNRYIFGFLLQVFLFSCVIHGYSQRFGVNTYKLHINKTAYSYITGKPDERAINIPVYIKEGITSDPKKYLDTLIEYLVKDTNDEFLKAKRIHDWITDNIAYDNDYYYKGLSTFFDPYSVLKEKRTVCDGFSRLFELMGTKAKIKVTYTSGIDKTAYDKNTKALESHAWNAVNINSVNYIVDVTFDCRIFYENKKRKDKSEYSDKNLLLSPKFKLNYFVPDKKEEQFLENPIDKKVLFRTPTFHHNFYTSDINFLSVNSKLMFDTISKKGSKYKLENLFFVKQDPLVFEFEVPNGIYFSTAIWSKSTDHSDYSYAKRNGNIIQCYFSSPGNGKYLAYISAYDTSGSYFPRILAFTLESDTFSNNIILPSNELILTNRVGVKVGAYNFDKKKGKLFLEITGSILDYFTAGIFENGKNEMIVKATSKIIKETDLEKTTHFDFPDYPAQEFKIKILENTGIQDEIRACIKISNKD